MKRLINFVIVLLTVANTTWGQQGAPMKKIHAAKIAYITDRVHLSPEQSAGFAPLYDKYEREQHDIRQSFFKKYKTDRHADCKDPETRQFLEDDLDYQQQMIELKRKYNDSFLKVITAAQLADMHKAEREFRQLLMQQLRQRHGGDKWR